MMTILLPIPSKRQTFSFFYIPYDINKGYVNKKAEVLLSNNQGITDLRTQLESVYGIAPAAFTVTKV
jgi:hypothetical protein